MKQFMHNSHMFVARLETVQVIQIQSFSQNPTSNCQTDESPTFKPTRISSLSFSLKSASLVTCRRSGGLGAKAGRLPMSPTYARRRRRRLLSRRKKEKRKDGRDEAQRLRPFILPKRVMSTDQKICARTGRGRVTRGREKRKEVE